MGNKHTNRMYAVEFTVGGWEKGYKDVKKSLLPLSSPTEAERMAEAEVKLSRSYANVKVSYIREVIT